MRDGRAQALSERRGFRQRCIRHQDAKFISARASQQIRGALVVVENTRDVQDGAVTDVVPVLIIYAFEAVNIDNGDAEGLMIATETVPLGTRSCEEITLVGKPRERIRVRQLPEVVGVLNEIRDVGMRQHTPPLGSGVTCARMMRPSRVRISTGVLSPVSTVSKRCST